MVDEIIRHKPKVNRGSDIRKPQIQDRCQTPTYALDPLLPYLNRQLRVWEPAAGEGFLVQALLKAEFQDVVSSDILTNQNFFHYAPLASWDVLITNPPYGIKYHWLKRCYELGKPFALLVPVETIGAKAAQTLMEKYGAEIMLLDRRVNFKMPFKGWDNSSAQFPTLWLCHGILPAPIVYGHIKYTVDKKDNSGQLSLWGSED